MAPTTYDLRVEIVDHVDNEGEPCQYCQLEGHEVQAQAYAPFDAYVESAGASARIMLECCLACLIPALDSMPYLDADQRIQVEVVRSATRRPF